MRDLFTPETRRWLYGIASTIVPLLIITGVVTEDVAGAILQIIAAVLGVAGFALARANVPGDKE